MRSEAFHRQIDAQHVPLALRLSELWHYRYLIRILTRKRLIVRYRQTVLGPAWQVIHPLLTSLAHMLIFGLVAGISTDGVPMILFYLAGNSLWSYVSSVVTQSANTFRNNAYLFGKVYFPRLCVPLSDALTAAVDFAIRFAMLLAVSVYYAVCGRMQVPFVRWLLLPGILLWLGMMAMGIGLLIASLTTKYRDLSILAGFGVQLWMYITPVVYPLSQLSLPAARAFILLNPATAPVELYRMLLFGAGGVGAASIVWSVLFTAAVFSLGVMAFNRAERTFVDTI